MTIRVTVTLVCSFCGQARWKKIGSDGLDLRECLNCKCVRDVSAIIEDQKHLIYHESGSPNTNQRDKK